MLCATCLFVHSVKRVAFCNKHVVAGSAGIFHSQEVVLQNYMIYVSCACTL